MSQTTRRDANGLPSSIAMPGGIRKSSRIAAQAEKSGFQDVYGIKESATQGSRKPRLERTDKKPVKLLRVASKPLRSSPRLSRQVALKVAQAVPRGSRGTAKGRSELLNRRIDPRSKAQPPRTTRQEADTLSYRGSTPLKKDVGTQTDDLIHREPQVQKTNSGLLRHDLVRAPLSKKALRHLELQLEGVNKERPIDIQDNLEADEMGRKKSVASAKSPSEKTTKTSNTTVYDEEFLVELEENGVFEQQFQRRAFKKQRGKRGVAPRIPKNFEEIRRAIEKDRLKSDDPTPQEYLDYAQKVYDGQSEDTVKDSLFREFFGITNTPPAGHTHDNRRWLKRVPITTGFSPQAFTKKPQPDRAEGIKMINIDPDVRNKLGGLAVPVKTLGFPNFMVEFKRDKSMYIAHTQNRHCGSVASQAFHEYYTKIIGKPSLSWDVARVGTVEFNGDVVTGNVHWVSKPDDAKSHEDVREYHMTRAFNRFAFGLSYEDFKTARKEARNFRDYFCKERQELLKRFAKDIRKRRAETRARAYNEAQGADLSSAAIMLEEQMDDHELAGEDSEERLGEDEVLHEDEDENDNEDATSIGRDSSGDGPELHSTNHTVDDTEESDSDATPRAGATPPRGQSNRRKRASESVVSTDERTKKRKTKTYRPRRQRSTNLTQDTNNLGITT